MISLEKMAAEVEDIHRKVEQIIKLYHEYYRANDRWLTKAQAMEMMGLKKGAFERRVAKGVIIKHEKGYLLSELIKKEKIL